MNKFYKKWFPIKEVFKNNKWRQLMQLIIKDIYIIDKGSLINVFASKYNK